MSKKVLVLTGSPRSGGNSDILADNFIEEAKKKGHEVSRFDAGRKNIQGCKACLKCFSSGNACIFDDDFNLLAEKIKDAEVLVMVFPLYWFTFSAQIKAAIDKIFAFAVAGKELKIKESMMIVCAQTDAEGDFKGTVESYRAICEYCKWENKGILLAGGIYEKGDVLKTEFPLKAKELVGNI